MTLAFFDSNVLVYVFGTGEKQEEALAILRKGGVVSVQSLNEVANVLRRKSRFEWAEVRQAIGYVRYYCPHLVDIDEAVHVDGLRLAERYQLSIYDAMIVAAALAAGCDTLYSEDMHAGLLVDDRLRIVNPFV